jgi:hypothetical protein
MTVPAPIGERIAERSIRDGRRVVASEVAKLCASGEQPDWIIENVAAVAYAHLLCTRDPDVDYGKAVRLGRRLWGAHKERMFSFAVAGLDDRGTAA